VCSMEKLEKEGASSGNWRGREIKKGWGWAIMGKFIDGVKLAGGSRVGGAGAD